MNYQQAIDLIGSHLDYGGSLDKHELAVAISSAPEVDKAAGTRALTLTGAQILEAFNYVAPDYPNDPDQLEHELTIQHGDGHSGEGIYCWFTDYPDEGSMLLDGTTATTITAPAVATPASESAAEDAWESYLGEQKRILGMPGLMARPCFLAGYRAALLASKSATVGLGDERDKKLDRDLHSQLMSEAFRAFDGDFNSRPAKETVRTIVKAIAAFYEKRQVRAALPAPAAVGAGDEREARRLIAELRGQTATFDGEQIGPTLLEQEAASFIETLLAARAALPAPAQGQAVPAALEAFRDALNSITAIENKMFGGDWDEIEEARQIAKQALMSGAPSYSKHVKWPEGYCLDPNGVMCTPPGMHEAWSFGYDLGYADALAARTAPPASAASEPVAQYQSKLRNPILPECDVWLNISEEGAKTIRENHSDVYEVRELFERSPASPVSSNEREALTLEQRDSIWFAAEILDKADEYAHAAELRALLASRTTGEGA